MPSLSSPCTSSISYTKTDLLYWKIRHNWVIIPMDLTDCNSHVRQISYRTQLIENVTCFPIVSNRAMVPDQDLYWVNKCPLYSPIIICHMFMASQDLYWVNKRPLYSPIIICHMFMASQDLYWVNKRPLYSPIIICHMFMASQDLYWVNKRPLYSPIIICHMFMASQVLVTMVILTCSNVRKWWFKLPKVLTLIWDINID